MSHTPAPWLVHKRRVYNSAGVLIAVAMSKRDASVIRCAPELLAFLKLALAEGATRPLHPSTKQRILAAIENAEG